MMASLAALWTIQQGANSLNFYNMLQDNPTENIDHTKFQSIFSTKEEWIPYPVWYQLSKQRELHNHNSSVTTCLQK